MNSFKSNLNKSNNKKNSNSLSFHSLRKFISSNNDNKPSILPPTPTSPASVKINTLHSLKIKTTTKNVPNDKNDKEELLLEPYNYLLAHPGKEIRAKMIEAFDYWLKVPKDQLTIITKVVEMLHNASLLIDDVEDNSTLRRGVPVAHNIFGVPATINCANYVYFLALNELTKLNNTKMLNIYTEELLNLHRGQGMELYWRDTLTCPSEEEFIEMVSNKTGGLLRLAVKLMQEASSSDEDYVGLVDLVGIHFQVRDDYMNMQSQTYADNKGFCEDLTEGKFSFPIIHSIQNTPDNANRQLINILKQRTTSIDLKLFAIKIMKETGSFEYTKQYLLKTEEKARNELTRLGGNPTLEKIMNILRVE